MSKGRSQVKDVFVETFCFIAMGLKGKLVTRAFRGTKKVFSAMATRRKPVRKQMEFVDKRCRVDGQVCKNLIVIP